MNRDFIIPVLPENTASLWLLSSIPTNFATQPTPTVIGWKNIINYSLSIDLVEPLNYQSRGWWTFTDKPWVGQGEYYILFVPSLCG